MLHALSKPLISDSKSCGFPSFPINPRTAVQTLRTRASEFHFPCQPSENIRDLLRPAEVSKGATGAVCWHAREPKTAECRRALRRLRHNCDACDVVTLDAEWTWHRPVADGVALLQLGFWPSCEVFCLRFEPAGRAPQGRPPRALRRLFRRGARDEAAIVGFALQEDRKRLERHGLCLGRAGAVDLQPWCTQEAGRPRGMSISLADAFRRLFKEDLDKEPRLTDWDGALSHRQLRYAATDAWT
ncbi:unnamed protein product, partial [Prorocentrum cordatum]